MLTLFMHVPKTGGQTLQDWLGHIYGPSSLAVWNPVSNPMGRGGLSQIREEFAALIASRPELRAVAGHFPYGVHTSAPTMFPCPDPETSPVSATSAVR
jgi:hypothetical protein